MNLDTLSIDDQGGTRVLTLDRPDAMIAPRCDRQFKMPQVEADDFLAQVAHSIPRSVSRSLP